MNACGYRYACMVIDVHVYMYIYKYIYIDVCVCVCVCVCVQVLQGIVSSLPASLEVVSRHGAALSETKVSNSPSLLDDNDNSEIMDELGAEDKTIMKAISHSYCCHAILS